MNCSYCKAQTTGNYVCDKCVAEGARVAALKEAEALKVKCQSCGQPAGSKCVTGSGIPRCAHVVREKAAARLSK